MEYCNFLPIRDVEEKRRSPLKEKAGVEEAKSYVSINKLSVNETAFYY